MPFVSSVIKYCGVKVSDKGIEKCKSITEAVREQKYTIDIRAFLGLVNFYRKFIKSNLTACRKTFKEIKNYITRDTIKCTLIRGKI